MEPTPIPSLEPTANPSVKPTAIPSFEPTAIPSLEPTANPSVKPTTIPSLEPTTIPSLEPTATPSVKPTIILSLEPTLIPSLEPTYNISKNNTNYNSNYASNVNKMSKTMNLVSIISLFGIITLIFCSCVLYLCFFKIINCMNGNNIWPLLNPILKKKKKKDEDEYTSYDIATYKTNPLFSKSVGLVKTYTLREKSDNDNNDDNWNSFPDNVEFNIENIYPKNDNNYN